MSTVEVRSQVSLDALLNGVAQLDRPELERFISEVMSLRVKRIAPSLPKEEARLLQKINQGLPSAAQQRCDELTAKRRAEGLTSEERQELLTLIDRIDLVGRALRQADVEVRDAAVQSLESRGTTKAVRLLKEHQDSVAWLQDYVDRVARELQQSQEDSHGVYCQENIESEMRT